MWGERGFSEKECVQEQQALEAQEANDPANIASAQAHFEAREHRKEDRHQRHRRWLGALRRLGGGGRGRGEGDTST